MATREQDPHLSVALPLSIIWLSSFTVFVGQGKWRALRLTRTRRGIRHEQSEARGLSCSGNSCETAGGEEAGRGESQELPDNERMARKFKQEAPYSLEAQGKDGSWKPLTTKKFLPECWPLPHGHTLAPAHPPQFRTGGNPALSGSSVGSSVGNPISAGLVTQSHTG